MKWQNSQCFYADHPAQGGLQFTRKMYCGIYAAYPVFNYRTVLLSLVHNSPYCKHLLYFFSTLPVCLDGQAENFPSILGLFMKLKRKRDSYWRKKKKKKKLRRDAMLVFILSWAGYCALSLREKRSANNQEVWTSAFDDVPVRVWHAAIAFTRHFTELELFDKRLAAVEIFYLFAKYSCVWGWLNANKTKVFQRWDAGQFCFSLNFLCVISFWYAPVFQA